MEKKTFAERFGRNGITARDARELHTALGELNADAGIEESERGLARCVKWVSRRSRRVSVDQRVCVFVEALESDDSFALRFARTFSHILASTRAEAMLETGIPNERGILEETTDRLSRKFLPTPRDERDLGALVARVFSRSHDPDWIEALPLDMVLRFIRIIVERSEAPWKNLHAALSDTLASLAARTTALGLSRDIRARSAPTTVLESPFYQLPRVIDLLISAADGNTDPCRSHISACRRILDGVLLHLDQFGVSVDLVYRIEVMSKNLDRIEELLEFVEPDSDRQARGATSLLARIARARIKDRSFRDLVGTNIHLLARKIIERVGHTGEHYITATRKEYGKMLVSAAGGGLITGYTAAIKYRIPLEHLPLFIDGLATSVNYALSFVAIQFFGATLATKQPSMTAAALGNALKDTEGENAIEDLVTMTARTTRSQLAAAIGNVLLVVPAGYAIDRLSMLIWHGHWLPHDAAEHILQSLHPFKTGTIFYASLTGVILWASSICAGWLENWAVYRRIPEGIANHPVRHVIGRRTTAWLARKFSGNIAGIGGNVSLGFMLGMTPVFGTFLGLPLEVRHVTLSAGVLAIAFAALGPEAYHDLAWASLGIGFVFIFNLAVSFILALVMAARARGAQNLGGPLFRALMRRMLRHPFEFVFPPKAPRLLAKERLQLEQGTHES
ncbi:MAG: hypothetical protein IPK60_18070 [Sandaracinaceae bacterium]|jgi:site-specific recombinase|nr:hypothetical protein [Sandaracinaceae bacterium]